MTVPAWVFDAIFYQIFPDRFANGDPTNDPVNVEPWGAEPTLRGFQGGDLRGVIDRLDYLTDLGVNAIYLNPIFAASSNHRYNTTDYYRIDPKLGDLADFHALLEAAHGRGMRVVLDGVFNHCGRGFFAFNDLLENGERSPYRDWFHVQRFPLDAYSSGVAKNYQAWWNLKELPKFNTVTPAVRGYLLEVATHWIRLGADGWRLDVPNEIDDDSFWAEFRQAVKAENSEAYLVGEIWEADPRWVGPNHFDGLLNYPLRGALLEFLVDDEPSAARFVEQVESLAALYPVEHHCAHYSLLGTHDTERIRTALGDDLDKVRLATLFQFTFPGAPGIYYGDEIGLKGGEDPDCRRAFPWDEGQWDHSLRGYLKQLIALRGRLPQLRCGDFERLTTQEPGGLAFRRGLEGSPSIAVLLNGSGSRITLEVPAGPLGWADGAEVQDYLTGARSHVAQGSLRRELAPLSGAVYLPSGTP